MADEKIWDGVWPAGQAFLLTDDTALVRKANGAAVQVAGTAVVARRVAAGPFLAEGLIQGGLGGSGGLSATGDWNSDAMARAGAGGGVYRGNSPNGPDTSNGFYYSLGLEQNPMAGTGLLTQIAIPANTVARGLAFRTRSAGVWSGWQSILSQNSSGQFLPRLDNSHSLGAAGARFSVLFAGSGVINTSDRRHKREIGPIPDEWLDAWGDVEWCRFQFTTGARWHVGLIAQEVHAAFEARGLDAFEIGLCCFDAWEEERAPQLDGQGNPRTKGRLIREEGDVWGLRYDECFAMEAAWNRRELALLREEARAEIMALRQAGEE